jgi:hypothetical protein
MPTPHTYLITAFAREELLVRYIQFFATKGAYVILYIGEAKKRQLVF